jgi:type I restriction enzyme S subunit
MDSDCAYAEVSLASLAASEADSFVDGPFGSNLKSDEYTTSGVRLIQLQNIGTGAWLDDNTKFISRRKFSSLARHGAVPGDIAIAKMAEPVARACLLPPVAQQFVVVADCIKLRPDQAKCDPRYLTYMLNSERFRKSAELMSSGSTRLRITLGALKQLTVLLPPLAHQHRIADVLDTADEAIRFTERLIAKLEQVKQGLLHDLLTRGIDKNGELRDPIVHLEQFANTSLGLIPIGWKVAALREACDLQVGFAFSSEWFRPDEGLRLLRGENVGYGSLDWGDTRFLDASRANDFAEYLLRPGDIVIGMDRTFTKSGFKVSDVTAHDAPCLLVQRVGRFVPGVACRAFLRCLLRSSMFRRELMAQQKGMDIPHLSKDEILAPVVAIPPPQEQEAIAARVLTLEKRIGSEMASLAKRRLVKTGLMNDLLTGRVGVADNTQDAA